MGFPLLLQHGKEDQHIGAVTQGQVWILFPCLSRRLRLQTFFNFYKQFSFHFEI